MTILDTSVSVSQVVDWGATQFVSEDLIRRWAKKDKLRLREVIALPIEPKVVIWILVRERFMSADRMHAAALQACRDFLDRLEAKRYYIDFRCRKLLAAKQEWLDCKISLGALRVVQWQGERALEDVAETGSAEAIAAVQASWQAANDHAETALKAVLNTVQSVYGADDDRRDLLTTLSNFLNEE